MKIKSVVQVINLSNLRDINVNFLITHCLHMDLTRIIKIQNVTSNFLMRHKIKLLRKVLDWFSFFLTLNIQ